MAAKRSGDNSLVFVGEEIVEHLVKGFERRSERLHGQGEHLRCVVETVVGLQSGISC